MIPPWLAGLAGKAIGLVLLVSVAYGMGQWHGRQAVQERWDAAVAQQAIDAAKTVVRAAEHTADTEIKFARLAEKRRERVRIVKEEVKVYVESPAKKCVVTPEFERLFDAVSLRMRDATADGLPAATDAAGAAPESPAATVTDAEVLLAYEHAVVNYFALWDTYTALRDWVRESYAIAKAGAGR